MKNALVKDATIVLMKNGRPRLAGHCNEDCGRRDDGKEVNVSRMMPPFKIEVPEKK